MGRGEDRRSSQQVQRSCCVRLTCAQLVCHIRLVNMCLMSLQSRPIPVHHSASPTQENLNSSRPTQHRVRSCHTKYALPLPSQCTPA